MWGTNRSVRRATRRGTSLARGAAALALAGAVAVPAPAGAVSPDDVDPDDFVTLQYQDFLARNPDAGGLEFWAERLRGGTDPASLIETMATSDEFASSVAPMVRLYQAHLQRMPDYDGLVFWVGQLGGGRPLAEISEHFSRSNEFQTKYGSLTDAEYVELVYDNVLDRSPDAAGLAFWVGWLGDGGSRGALMANFSESSEHVAATDGRVKATMLYLGLLRRVPDSSGLDWWADQLQNGMPWHTAMHGFLHSDEYRERLDALFAETHPLTGEATATATDLPALAVKIDNVANARPQLGIRHADVVVEEMVEGSFTRLIAIYQSGEPAQVGPVRSIRSTDFDVLAMLDWPLLAASGANGGVLGQLDGARVVNVNALEAGNAYYRASGRRAPHNMFATTARLRAFAGSQGATPGSVFTYRDAAAPVPGSPSGGVFIDFGNSDARWTWDAPRAAWTRLQNGSAHVDADGGVVAPQNVVVLEVTYGVSAIDAESPEAHTVGSGTAHVFTGGNVATGTWSRSAATDPFTLKDAAGNVIGLTAGQTWVELAPAGAVTLR